MVLVDTHAHIYLKQFDEDLEAMLERSKGLGIEKIFMPNIDLETIDSMLEVEKKFPEMCLPMLGLHPCDVKDDFEKILDEMRSGFNQHKYYGVGETGLDYHWDMTFVEQQKLSLAQHVHWANELELPLILHTRKSFDDTYEVVKKHMSENLTGIFHCFGGSVEEAQKVFDLGFYIGIGGVLTFKKSGLDNVMAELPLDRVVLETDSPYLAPTPYRGKRNESSYVRLIAEKLAEVKGISLDEVAEITTANAYELFGIV